MAESNPLNSFFRKAKFQLTLPSRGRWYPKSALAPSVTNGSINVFAMTAADETKFKMGDAAITGNNTYDLIRSCLPDIKQPEQVPMCDLDAILLAVRKASYGDNLQFSVKVPDTNLMRDLDLNIGQMLGEHFGNESKWDENLEITDADTGDKMTVVFKPMNLRTLFGHTKTMLRLQQLSVRLADANDIADDQKLEALNENIMSLSQVNVAMMIDSIESITAGDYSTRNPADIRNFLSQIDVEYFKAMQDHLDIQRKNVGLQPIYVDSTEEELAAGAPARWEAEINFTTADFFK